MENDDFSSAANLSYENARREAVAQHISRWWPNAPQVAIDHAQYTRAVEALTKDAMSFASSHGISATPARDGWHSEFDDVLNQVQSFIVNLAFSLNIYSDDNVDLRLWSHQIDLANKIQNGNIPAIVRADLEVAVGEYLKLPFRSNYVDRLLVDVLMATEIYAYGAEISAAPYIPGFSQHVTLKFSPTLNWLAGNFMVVLLWAILAGLFWVVSVIHLFPPDWLIGLNFIFAGLFLLNLVWTTAWLPFLWVKVATAKRQMHKLMSEMIGAYTELRSAGPISAGQVQYRARKASDAGVGWPSPLFVLLDDILARGGTL